MKYKVMEEIHGDRVPYPTPGTIGELVECNDEWRVLKFIEPFVDTEEDLQIPGENGITRRFHWYEVCLVFRP